MEIEFCCTYCGHKWIDKIFSGSYSQFVKCKLCGDKKIKARRIEEEVKIDYYQGAPEFKREDKK